MEKIILKKSVEEKAAERSRSMERIYAAALEQHTQFKQIPEQDIKEVIGTALEEIEKLERAGNLSDALTALTLEVAESISALWVFSGPGSYDEPAKEDRYKNYPWARGMDRARLSYGALLSRKISEKLSSEILKGSISKVSARIQKARELIAEHGPTIIYNGTELENSVARDVLTREGIIIPPEKAIIAGEGIDNTVDQIKDFKFPEELHQSGGEIGIVSHAPHIMRIIHILSQYQTLPKDMTVRLFPMATPQGGKEEYADNEIKGLLYYVFLAKKAQPTAYPALIHGEKHIS